jgi:hypothetical protein
VKVIRVLLLLLFIFVLTACKPPATPTTPPNEPEEPAPPGEDAIVVTSTADSGFGTLRQALNRAEHGDTILFDPDVFPPGAPATIYVRNEALPGIRSNVTIDASNAGVILDGSQLVGDWVAGLQTIRADGVSIMGLRIQNFNGPGISITAATNNTIGGDRSIGSGPYGQGNMLVANNVGLDISDQSAKHNTITGNLIGIDLDGSDWLGNLDNGILVWEGVTDNTIGPNNRIVNNGNRGIGFRNPNNRWENQVIENEIYYNAIYRGNPYFPSILDIDFAAGRLTGATCPNCTVEIYSTSEYEGEILEAETTADDDGVFMVNKGEPFTGPLVTARATNSHQRSSWFIWPPISQTEQILVLQTGNTAPRTQFYLKHPGSLPDNHIATQYDGISYENDETDWAMYKQAVTRGRVSTNGIEPHPDMDWNKPEMPLSQDQQDHFTRLADRGVILTFVLIYWDTKNSSGPGSLPCYRFQTEEEIEDWLVFVRYIVETLHDRVQYFEIWNEPDIANFCPKSIYLDDYINLIKVTAPVIHEVEPEAKIVVGGVSGTAYDNSYNYLLGVLRSDAMPLVDVISWHPMYNFTPDIPRFRNYYYAYPDKIQEIKDTAEANGFEGEYHADEISFRSEFNLDDTFYEYSQVVVNKYFLQSAIMHRGEGIDIGLGSGYYVINRVSLAMAGVEPEPFEIEVDSNAEHLMSYTFSTLNDEKMVAVWRHTEVSEFDPGTEATLTIPNTTASKVVAIDLLYNMEQELNFEIVDGDLVIENLLVKDYPILIILEP